MSSGWFLLYGVRNIHMWKSKENGERKYFDPSLGSTSNKDIYIYIYIYIYMLSFQMNVEVEQFSDMSKI